MMDVYLNGRMIAYDKALVPHDDASIQHAVGLFETMTAEHGSIFRLEAHLERLVNSASELGMTSALDIKNLHDAITTTLTHNRLERTRIRLTVTPGCVSLLRGDESQPPKPTILVVATDPIDYEPTYFESGITVIVGPALANPFDPLAGHKTMNYWSRLRTLRQAASVPCGEAIILNVSNHLASGTVSNIFLVKAGHLLTPIARGEEVPGGLTAPVLPGITRAAVLELGSDHDLTIEKRMLDIEDLLNADEVFLTNSSWHILPVTRIEKHPIGNGKVGSVTSQLRAFLLELMERERMG